MFITHKKGLKLDGTTPTLLYAYGGFDISMKPAFSVTNLAWLEAGGVYAMPNLRGGGESGETDNPETRFAYVEPPAGGPATIFEIMELSDVTRGMGVFVRDAAKDCKIYLTPFPTLACFHASCRVTVEETSKRIRKLARGLPGGDVQCKPLTAEAKAQMARVHARENTHAAICQGV